MTRKGSLLLRHHARRVRWYTGSGKRGVRLNRRYTGSGSGLVIPVASMWPYTFGPSAELPRVHVGPERIRATENIEPNRACIDGSGGRFHALDGSQLKALWSHLRSPIPPTTFCRQENFPGYVMFIS